MARIIRAERLRVNPQGVLFLPAFSDAYATGPTVVGALSIKPILAGIRGWPGARCSRVRRSDASALSFAAPALEAGSEVFALVLVEAKVRVFQPADAVYSRNTTLAVRITCFHSALSEFQGEHAWTGHG